MPSAPTPPHPLSVVSSRPEQSAQPSNLAVASQCHASWLLFRRVPLPSPAHTQKTDSVSFPFSLERSLETDSVTSPFLPPSLPLSFSPSLPLALSPSLPPTPSLHHSSLPLLLFLFSFLLCPSGEDRGGKRKAARGREGGRGKGGARRHTPARIWFASCIALALLATCSAVAAPVHVGEREIERERERERGRETHWKQSCRSRLCVC
jgi:hypothetical protein